MGFLKNKFKSTNKCTLFLLLILTFGCKADINCASIYESISTIDITYESDSSIEPYIYEMYEKWVNPMAGLKLAKASERKVYLEKFGNILLNKAMLSANKEGGIADIEFLLKNGTNIYPIDGDIKKTVENAIANAALHKLGDVLDLLTGYSHDQEKINLAKSYIKCINKK